MRLLSLTFTAIATAALLTAPSAFAGGDKNAYNNPGGDPPDFDGEMPYTNEGDGRIMIFCADGETLVVKTIDGGAMEATCLADDD